MHAKGLAQCYDTTADVGFAGGFAGDANQKRNGLHFAWLILAIVALVGFWHLRRGCSGASRRRGLAARWQRTKNRSRGRVSRMPLPGRVRLPPLLRQSTKPRLPFPVTQTSL